MGEVGMSPTTPMMNREALGPSCSYQLLPEGWCTTCPRSEYEKGEALGPRPLFMCLETLS